MAGNGKKNPEQIARNRDVSRNEMLSELQFRVLREKGTEPPFTGKYLNEKRQGIYKCAGCHSPLYESCSKYDSGSGWPSFFEPLNHEVIELEKDTSHEMTRTEIICRNCNGHLGHLFDDGPEPTGMRHCINSAALIFVAEED